MAGGAILSLDVGYGSQDTLALVTGIVIVTELKGLILSRAGARRHGHASPNVVIEEDIDLDGRVSPGVQYLLVPQLAISSPRTFLTLYLFSRSYYPSCEVVRLLQRPSRSASFRVIGDDDRGIDGAALGQRPRTEADNRDTALEGVGRFPRGCHSVHRWRLPPYRFERRSRCGPCPRPVGIRISTHRLPADGSLPESIPTVVPPSDLRAPAGRLHHAAPAAAHEHDSAPPKLGPHLLRESLDIRRRPPPRQTIEICMAISPTSPPLRVQVYHHAVTHRRKWNLESCCPNAVEARFTGEEFPPRRAVAFACP